MVRLGFSGRTAVKQSVNESFFSSSFLKSGNKPTGKSLNLNFFLRIPLMPTIRKNIEPSQKIDDACSSGLRA